MDKIINHAVLSLDFWQDTVTYEGCAMPTGTIGCEVLNISAEAIETLTPPCDTMNRLLQGMNTGTVDLTLLPQVQGAASGILSFMDVTPPFSRLSNSDFGKKLADVFSAAYLEDARDYLQLSQQEQLLCTLTGQHSRAAQLIRMTQVLGHLSYSLRQYKDALLPFVQQLNEPGHDRTAEGYAALFGQFFQEEPTLSDGNPSWMTLTNASVQYVSVGEPPKLARRMNYVSLVGLLRSDLFEGLAAGHAPRRCAVRGRWFLTLDARRTKYCGGFAPGDAHGRTCRQVGAMRGREQRELAGDHPLKAIYNRRLNTILQSQRRGRLDEATADAMRKLAKDKLQRALSDADYACAAYESEMTQEALRAEAERKC